MSAARLRLADEPDFALGPLKVSPSTCRVHGPDGEVRVEAQTMAVLVTLVRAGGATAPRDQLIEACWQGRVVSDDAVTRTIAKVRALAGAASPAAFTLETIPKVGYRLLAVSASDGPAAATPRARRPIGWIAGALVASGAAGVLILAGLAHVNATASPAAASAPPSPSALPLSADVADAILTLDEQRLQRYLKAGWSPNWHLDSEGNAALHILMEVCERNPTHDKAGVARVARQLVAAGADPRLANKWGDTPLTIARAKRYCGPDHPVVTYLRGVAGSAG